MLDAVQRFPSVPGRLTRPRFDHTVRLRKKRRLNFLFALLQLPMGPVAELDEVPEYIEQRRLYGRGVGYVDVHLLASMLGGTKLWTRDKTTSIGRRSTALRVAGCFMSIARARSGSRSVRWRLRLCERCPDAASKLRLTLFDELGILDRLGDLRFDQWELENESHPRTCLWWA